MRYWEEVIIPNNPRYERQYKHHHHNQSLPVTLQTCPYMTNGDMTYL